MELAQLRMFKAVADHGSMTKAAEMLHCVPSNVTARIKALEDEFGVVLFHRGRRKLRITDQGEALLKYTKAIFALTEEAFYAVSNGETPRGEFSLGAIESSAISRLPRLLGRYHSAYPEVRLQLSTGTWSSLLTDVRRGRLDAAIVAVDVDDVALCSRVIYEESLLIIAAESLGAIETAEDLRGKAVFMWPEGCPYRAALSQWLGSSGEKAQITSIASYGTIVGCVSAGAGVALVPKGIYLQYAAGTGIRGYEISDLAPIRNRFVWSSDCEHHAAREAFMRLLFDESAFPDVMASTRSRAG